MKRCAKCKHEFPATSEFFHRSKYRTDGLYSYCKACACKRVRRYCEANRDKEHKRQKTWRKANLKNGARRQKRYIEANPDKRREALKRYRRNHPETIHTGNHRRRARKVAAGGSYTTEDVRLQLQNQTDRKGVARCWWCNEPMGDDQSIDHRIPLSRGGSNDARNIVIVHLHCNQVKYAKLPHEYNGRLL